MSPPILDINYLDSCIGPERIYWFLDKDLLSWLLHWPVSNKSVKQVCEVEKGALPVSNSKNGTNRVIVIFTTMFNQ